MIIKMQLVRCIACRTVLFSQGVFRGTIEVRCRKNHCRVINQITFDNGLYKIKRKEAEELAEKTYTVI